MIESLDNRMLFGALQNLKLAPHVREGRRVDGPGAVRPEQSARAAEKPTPGPRATEPSGERLTLSAEALALAAGLSAESDPSSPDPIEPETTTVAPAAGSRSWLA